MPEAELKELGEDIKKHGLHEGVACIDGLLLDGRNRLDAAELAGIKLVTGNGQIDWAIVQCRNVGSVDPVAYVVSRNLHRRHLTSEQKRELIGKLVKATPEKSDRQIAEQTKASPSTVGKVRKQLETTGDVSKLDTRTDANNRKQQAHKPKQVHKPKQSLEGIADTINTAIDQLADAVPEPSIKDNKAVMAAADRAEARAHKANAKHAPNFVDKSETPRASDPISKFVSGFELAVNVTMEPLNADECRRLIAALRAKIDVIEMAVAAASREPQAANAGELASIAAAPRPESQAAPSPSVVPPEGDSLAIPGFLRRAAS